MTEIDQEHQSEDTVSEASQNSNAPSKDKRQRGTGFPKLALDDAVRATQAISDYGFRSNKSAAAEFLGHKSANNGAFTAKIAALRDYGLIERDGNDIVVTELGQRLSYPESEDPEDHRLALETAFRNADVFAKTLDGLSPNRELSPENIGNSAVRNLKVSPKSKDQFLESFLAGARSAGLLEDSGNGTVKKVATGDSDEDGFEKPPGPKYQEGDSDEVPVVHHRWSIAGGQVIFQIFSSNALPAYAYGKVQAVIEAGDELVSLLDGLNQDDNSS